MPIHLSRSFSLSHNINWLHCRSVDDIPATVIYKAYNSDRNFTGIRLNMWLSTFLSQLLTLNIDGISLLFAWMTSEANTPDTRNSSSLQNRISWNETLVLYFCGCFFQLKIRHKKLHRHPLLLNVKYFLNNSTSVTPSTHQFWSAKS